MKFLIALSLIYLMFSCTVEKRLVNKGYHVKWNFHLKEDRHKNDNSTISETTEKEENEPETIFSEEGNTPSKADTTSKLDFIAYEHINVQPDSKTVQKIIAKPHLNKQKSQNNKPQNIIKKQEKLRNLEENYSRNVFLSIFSFNAFFICGFISGLVGLFSPIVAGIIGLFGFAFLFLSIIYSIKGMKDMIEEENRPGFLIASIPIATLLLTTVFALYATILFNSVTGIIILLACSLLLFIAYFIARFRLKHNPFKRFIVSVYLLIFAILILMMPFFPFQG